MNDNIFEEKTAPKLIARFSLPAIAGMSATAGYQVLDRMFIGKGIDTQALSAMAIVTPITMLLGSFSLLISSGTASSLSLKIGEKDIDGARMVLGNAIVLCILFGILVLILCMGALTPLLKFLGAGENIIPYALSYLKLAFSFAVSLNLCYVLGAALHAGGKPIAALLVTLGSAVLNTVLSALFIFRLDLGIRGSILASSLTQTFFSLLMLSYYMFKKNSFNISFKYLLPNVATIKKIFLIGIPVFLVQALTCLSFLVANNIFKKHGGENALAVVGIVGVISLLIFLPVSGLSQGIQPLLGYNYGKRDFQKVLNIFAPSILYATVYCLLIFFITFNFSSHIIGAFTKSNSILIPLGSKGIKYGFIALPITGLQIVGMMYFQAIGKFSQAAIIIISKQVIIQIPALVLLSKYFGINGAIAAFPVTDLFTTGIVICFLSKEWKLLKKAKTPTLSSHAAVSLDRA